MQIGLFTLDGGCECLRCNVVISCMVEWRTLCGREYDRQVTNITFPRT